MKNPTNPFVIGDDLRKQYEYFRSVRNDCAHAKNNIIGSSHVEVLWIFIQSNYNRFTVNGGKEGLMQRIKDYYDINLTAPHSDIQPIIDDIRNSMKRDEIPEFLGEIYQWQAEIIWGSGFESRAETYEFWNKIITSADENLINSLITFVKSDDEVFLNFIDAYPDKLIEILRTSNETFIRKFWNQDVEKMIGSWQYKNGWIIAERLLKNDIIPADEKERFFNLLLDTKRVPSDDCVEYFKSIGYLVLIKDKVFKQSNNFSAPYGIDYANSNWSTIKFLVCNLDLDEIMVKQLNQALKASSYGTFYEGMLRILKDNSDILNRYKKVISTVDVEIAPCISEIDNN